MLRSTLIAAVAVMCTACSAGTVRDKVTMKLQPFDLGQVRLLDGDCKRAQEANGRYLLDLDPDRLLHAFRLNAGLPSTAKPLGGWESPDCEVRGHFVGHYISALSMLYRSTGDRVYKDRADMMVAELAKCQKGLGKGYLSAFPESFWDRLEAPDRVPWAPYYTIHKIMAGMFDAYTLCGNEQALGVLKGMAAYFSGRFDRLSQGQIDRILGVEYGAMNEVLYNLYSVTGDPAHLKLAHTFDRAAFLGPLALEHDNLTGLHGNTHIAIIRGAARRYELTGDERYRTITRFFWDTVTGTRCYASGGTTVAEMWPEPNRLALTLAINNHECCKTHNLLNVTRYLIRWTADPRLADYYERAFFNGILGTQDPETGMLIYYVPLASGYPKVFGTPNDTFWCCYGTGVESFAKLADSVYFHDSGGLYVNMYIPSELTWTDKGVTVRQETRFPEDSYAKLTISALKPTSFALSFHVPYWAVNGARVSVNGKPIAVKAVPTSYLKLKREWRNGDVVKIDLPMSLHVHRMPDDPDMMAIMYGPLVLAGIMDELQGPQKTYLIGDPGKPADWIKPVKGKPLTFRVTGQERNWTLVPLNRILRERYAVYWIVAASDSRRCREIKAEEEARMLRAARTIDQVIIGDGNSESAHGMKGEKTGAGQLEGRTWRHATDGGWFSYDLALPKEGAVSLACTYWGSDSGPREFDIIADGTTIATQTLNNNKPGEFFDVEYPLSRALIDGKATITIRFQAKPGNFAGGVFGCATVRPG